MSDVIAKLSREYNLPILLPYQIHSIGRVIFGVCLASALFSTYLTLDPNPPLYGLMSNSTASSIASFLMPISFVGISFFSLLYGFSARIAYKSVLPENVDGLISETETKESQS